MNDEKAQELREKLRKYEETKQQMAAIERELSIVDVVGTFRCNGVSWTLSPQETCALLNKRLKLLQKGLK